MSKYLENVIKELTDGEVEIEYSKNGFFYDVDNGGTIYYTLNDSFYHDIDWRTFLNDKFDFALTPYNWFTMSILHELGHHYTIDYFDAVEWNSMCELIDSEDSHEINFYHFNQPNELVATQFAVDYYRKNKTEMNRINRKFKKAFKKIK